MHITATLSTAHKVLCGGLTAEGERRMLTLIRVCKNERQEKRKKKKKSRNDDGRARVLRQRETPKRKHRSRDRIHTLACTDATQKHTYTHTHTHTHSHTHSNTRTHADIPHLFSRDASPQLLVRSQQPPRRKNSPAVVECRSPRSRTGYDHLGVACLGFDSMDLEAF
jgi:hypothetical protein